MSFYMSVILWKYVGRSGLRILFSLLNYQLSLRHIHAQLSLMGVYGGGDSWCAERI